MTDKVEKGKSSVDSLLNDIEETLEHCREISNHHVSNIDDAVMEEKPRTGTIKSETKELETFFVEMAHRFLDMAKNLNAIRTGTTFRALENKEPVGYSKPDAGATHDAYYGAASSNRVYMREVKWPLRLDDWEKIKADRKENGEYEKVSATGMKKYRKYVGSSTVQIVVSEPDPPI